MIRLKIYNNEKTYITPDMKQLTPEMAAMKYDIINTGLPCVIETDAQGVMLYTVPEPIHIAADRLGIDPEAYQNVTDLITAMEEVLNAPAPEPAPSAEERIASALEFQNILTLPEETE